MAWVRLSAESKVLTIKETEAEIDALLETGDTKLEETVEQLGDVDIGWYYKSADQLFQIEPIMTNDQTKLNRRVYLTGLLRKAESIGGKLAVWGASKFDDKPIGDPPMTGDDERQDESKRLASYGRWVEANTRAMLLDENLENDAKYAFLKAECEIDPETWYWLHKVNGTEANGGWYEIYLNNNRSTWDWHYTTGSSTSSNSRIGVGLLGTLKMSVEATSDWVRALQ